MQKSMFLDFIPKAMVIYGNVWPNYCEGHSEDKTLI